MTNQEIWRRCQKVGVVSTKVNRDSPLIMGKYCYDKVVAKQRGACDVKITTQLKFAIKKFEPLPPIPSVLTNIIPAPDDGNSFLPNYDAYFKKAGLLEEGILIYF